MKKLIWIVLAVIVVGAVVGYRMWNKPPTQVEDVKATTVTATELCSAYAADEAAANAKYLNQALNIKGVVAEVSTNQDGNLMVALDGGDETSKVQCTMRDKNVQISKGSAITVKGFCSGYILFEVAMTDCVVEKE